VMRELSDEEMKRVPGGGGPDKGNGHAHGTDQLAPANGARDHSPINQGPGYGNGAAIL
jgi:hypothetical protein